MKNLGIRDEHMNYLTFPKILKLIEEEMGYFVVRGSRKKVKKAFEGIGNFSEWGYMKEITPYTISKVKNK